MCIKIRRISLLVVPFTTCRDVGPILLPSHTEEIAFNNFSRFRFARNFKFIKPRGHASNGKWFLA